MSEFNKLYGEMVKAADFAKYKTLDVGADNADDLYNKITLRGDLRDYNQKQLTALMNYAKIQLPNKSDEQVQEFMLRSLSDPKVHEILRKHIAYHNPELFEYIS